MKDIFFAASLRKRGKDKKEFCAGNYKIVFFQRLAKFSICFLCELSLIKKISL